MNFQSQLHLQVFNSARLEVSICPWNKMGFGQTSNWDEESLRFSWRGLFPLRNHKTLRLPSVGSDSEELLRRVVSLQIRWKLEYASTFSPYGSLRSWSCNCSILRPSISPESQLPSTKHKAKSIEEKCYLVDHTCNYAFL
jgi:hypothetical protein